MLEALPVSPVMRPRYPFADIGCIVLFEVLKRINRTLKTSLAVSEICFVHHYRCVYTGEQLELARADCQPMFRSKKDQQAGAFPSGRARRSQRKTGPPPGVEASRRPLLCRAGDGSVVPMHTCDLAFITYELLRKELGSGTRGRWGHHLYALADYCT